MTDGQTENRTPISHLATAGVTNMNAAELLPPPQIAPDITKLDFCMVQSSR